MLSDLKNSDIRIQILWDITLLHEVTKFRRFEKTCYLHLQLSESFIAYGR